MKALTISLRSMIFMTVLLGGIYPMVVLLLGQSLFPIRSNGSIVYMNERAVGSELIAQNFIQKKYFHPRPSAINYKVESSGASQKSATNADLKNSYKERVRILGEKAPIDLLTASASGMDPHISLEAAHYQKVRVMKVRNLTEDQMNELILKATEERFLGFMGQPRVNVLKLNQFLDKN